MRALLVSDDLTATLEKVFSVCKHKKPCYDQGEAESSAQCTNATNPDEG